MANLNKPTKFDTVVDPESLTEQEHKDSCDINKMIASAHRGQQVRGGNDALYGYDDTTLTGLQHRINKQTLEEDLRSAAENISLTESELKHVPYNVQKQFGFKAAKNEPPNPADSKNDQTKKQLAGKKQQQNKAENIQSAPAENDLDSSQDE